MTKDKTVKFATYGPNRGQSLRIGAYIFVDGVCEINANDASAASSVLCRYHDVCPEHELDEQIAEYDKKYNKKAAPTTPKSKTLEQMNKNELEAYALEKFNVDVDKRKTNKQILDQIYELQEAADNSTANPADNEDSTSEGDADNKTATTGEDAS